MGSMPMPCQAPAPTQGPRQQRRPAAIDRVAAAYDLRIEMEYQLAMAQLESAPTEQERNVAQAKVQRLARALAACRAAKEQREAEAQEIAQAQAQAQAQVLAQAQVQVPPMMAGLQAGAAPMDTGERAYVNAARRGTQSLTARYQQGQAQAQARAEAQARAQAQAQQQPQQRRVLFGVDTTTAPPLSRGGARYRPASPSPGPHPAVVQPRVNIRSPGRMTIIQQAADGVLDQYAPDLPVLSAAQVGRFAIRNTNATLAAEDRPPLVTAECMGLANWAHFQPRVAEDIPERRPDGEHGHGGGASGGGAGGGSTYGGSPLGGFPGNHNHEANLAAVGAINKNNRTRGGRARNQQGGRGGQGSQQPGQAFNQGQGRGGGGGRGNGRGNFNRGGGGGRGGQPTFKQVLATLNTVATSVSSLASDVAAMKSGR